MTQQQRRRRGTELKEAIYISAIEILENEGYKAITFQNIANRAQTSRSVLYRSWSSPFLLLYEAVRWNTIQNGIGSIGDASYDTGSLRGDLIALCQLFVNNSQAFSSEFLKVFLNEMIQNQEITHLWEKMIASNLLVIGKIIERAIIRGEIKHEVCDLVKLLPFEVLRYHIVFMKDGVDDKFIEQLVDHIMLPAMTKDNNVEG